MQKDMFMHRTLETIMAAVLVIALMVDFFWNRMIFEAKDALWGWLVLLALSLTKAIYEKKSFEQICDRFLIITAALAIGATFSMVTLKKFYSKKMLENEEGNYVSTPIDDEYEPYCSVKNNKK